MAECGTRNRARAPQARSRPTLFQRVGVTQQSIGITPDFGLFWSPNPWVSAPPLQGIPGASHRRHAAAPGRHTTVPCRQGWSRMADIRRRQGTPPPQVSVGVGKPPHGLGVCIWMPLVNGTGNSPSPGRPTPGVVKQDKSSGASVNTTKTRSGPQRVRMSSGERPIAAANGKQSDSEALCQPPPPPRAPIFHSGRNLQTERLI